MSDTDISLAIRIDDISLLEMVYQSQKPPKDDSGVAMMLDNPESNFEVDEEFGRIVLRAVVTVRYELGEKAGQPDSDPALIYGTTLGVVVSAPVMGEAVVHARHMAGADDARSRRDDKMAHALRLEAIKAAHGFASAKLAELTALSPSPKMLLPAIDAEVLLADIERQQVEQEG